MDVKLWSPLSRANQEKLKIVKAEGVYLYDENNIRYVDMNSGLWNVCLGYSNPAVLKAISEQQKKLQYVNPFEFVSEPAVELADLIIRMVQDHFDKCIFTCTGSETNDLAIKMIRKYHHLKGNHQKKYIACISRSYHGSYYGSMTLSSYGREYTSGYGPLLENIIELSLPYSREKNMSHLETLKKELAQYKDELAGIIFEPVLGSAGVIPLPLEWLKEIFVFCHENDALVVCDEVATGFGRTGTMFYGSQFNEWIDMICMSKGINNGILPFGALVISKKITTLFEQNNEMIFHLSTQNCNPICCKSAIATIHELTKNNEQIIKDVTMKGQLFEDLLYKELQDCMIFHSIRREGLMIAIELKGKDNEVLSFEQLMYIRNEIFKKRIIVEWCWTKDLISSLALFPAFVMDDHVIVECVHIISSEIKKAGELIF